MVLSSTSLSVEMCGSSLETPDLGTLRRCLTMSELKSSGTASGIARLIITLVVVALISLALGAGNFVGGMMTDVQKANCAFIESGIRQLAPEGNQTDPQTAEDCMRAADTGSLFLKGVYSIISCIAIVFLVMTVFAFRVITGRQRDANADGS